MINVKDAFGVYCGLWEAAGARLPPDLFRAVKFGQCGEGELGKFATALRQMAGSAGVEVGADGPQADAWRQLAAALGIELKPSFKAEKVALLVFSDIFCRQNMLEDVFKREEHELEQENAEETVTQGLTTEWEKTAATIKHLHFSRRNHLYLLERRASLLRQIEQACLKRAKKPLELGQSALSKLLGRLSEGSALTESHLHALTKKATLLNSMCKHENFAESIALWLSDYLLKNIDIIRAQLHFSSDSSPQPQSGVTRDGFEDEERDTLLREIGAKNAELGPMLRSVLKKLVKRLEIDPMKEDPLSLLECAPSQAELFSLQSLFEHVAFEGQFQAIIDDLPFDCKHRYI